MPALLRCRQGAECGTWQLSAKVMADSQLWGMLPGSLQACDAISLQNATEELERLEHAFDSVKKQLFRRLHEVARAQLFQQAPAHAGAPKTPLMLSDGKTDEALNGSNGAGMSRRKEEGSVTI
jgi:hypothetical protein